MTTARFENVLVGREIGSLGEDRPMLLKLLPGNQCPPRQLVEWVNEKLTINAARHTIILKIGCNPKAAENMIRLTEPGFIAPVLHVEFESAAKYITGGKTESQPFRSDHHAAKIKS
jgi:hypothetical protein